MVDDGRGGRLPHDPVRYRIVAEKRGTGERVEGVVDWDGLSDLWAVETEGGSTRFVSVLDDVIEWEPVGFAGPASNGQGGHMTDRYLTAGDGVTYGPFPASDGQEETMPGQLAIGEEEAAAAWHDATGPRFPRITVELVGHDGNIFNVIGLVSAAMRRANVPQDTITEFVEDVTSQHSYDGALATVCKWVDVE